MHPADLAQHRQSRQRADTRALERDLARLLPGLNAEGRYEATRLVDAAKAGHLPLHQAHNLIRQQLSTLARAA